MFNKVFDAVIIGGGAAGFFAAIAAREKQLLILEQTNQLLSKVKVSGGGRCNVTHACFDPVKLVGFYPRGGKALRGAFSRFQPQDTIDWFGKRGVILKTEEDGRVFPITDDSSTIVDCFLKETKAEIRKRQKVEDLFYKEGLFHIVTREGELLSKKLLLATGGSRAGHELAAKLGHTIVEPVPSLFTLNIPNSPLRDLAGISFDEVALKLDCCSYVSKGPLLVTHWGFSGPAVLKLSAWAARDLHDCGYKAKLKANWVGRSFDEVYELLLEEKQKSSSRQVEKNPMFSLPKRFWQTVVKFDGRWGAFPKKEIRELARRLAADEYSVDGKTAFKQEFVTAGGVALNEVDFKTMESKLVPGLHFAGEILDIDGVTGGFNFQNAWTTGFLAGSAL